MEIPDNALETLKIVLTISGATSTGYVLLTNGRDWFLKRGIVLQIFVVSLTMLLSVISGGYYFKEVKRNADFMERSVITKLMTNDQPYRAFEAYVLSGIDTARSAGNWDSQSDRMDDLFADLQKKIDTVKNFATNPFPRDTNFFVWSKEVVVGSVQYTPQGFLTTLDSNLYLYQPEFSFEAGRSVFNNPKPDIANLFRLNPDILKQINIAYVTKNFIDEALKKSIDQHKVVQCFFLNDAGTLLIQGKDENDNPISYSNNFMPHKYFAARPYFIETIKSQRSHGNFDYVSMPYIDYGGNGVIITYCLRLRLPDNRNGIMAIDCKVHGGDDVIKKRIGNLYQEASFKISKKGKRIELDTLSAVELRQQPDEIYEMVQSQIQSVNEKGNTSEFTGQLIEISDAVTKAKTEKLFFTIPTGWNKLAGTTNMKLAVINLNAFKKNVWWFVFALAFFTISISYTILMIMNYTTTRREQEFLLQKFADIMQDSTIPFGWFNNKNEFVTTNKAFSDLLGYDSPDELKYKKHNIPRRFLDLMSSKEEHVLYNDMLERSAKGEPTLATWWYLTKKDGSIINACTHAEGVLIRHSMKDDQLHRFGVVIRTKPAKIEDIEK